MKKAKHRISKFKKPYIDTPLLKKIELGLREVKLHLEGKLNLITLNELLNEL